MGDNMEYKDMDFKVPKESESYREDSKMVVERIIKILDERKAKKDNKIIINTNLKLGLPLENINKIAGPMVEAWAYEVFNGIRDDLNNPYDLIIRFCFIHKIFKLQDINNLLEDYHCKLFHY